MISAVVLTKNSEKYLKRLISGLGFCGEIILVDDNSTDGSVGSLVSSKVRVIKKELVSFAESKNVGMDAAKGDWIFFIDSDELPTGKLKKEIQKAVRENTYDGFYIKRKDIFLGRKMRYGDVGEKYLLRFVKKGKGEWSRAVHEILEVRGKVGKLDGFLMHYHDRSLLDFVSGIDRYSTLHAEENRKEGKRSSLFKIVIIPPIKFLNTYFFKLGFLDGTHGFIMAMISAFHSYLSWSKQWLNQRKA